MTAMKFHHTLAGIAGFVALAAAGVAVASNLTSSHTSDYFSPGKHHFYVWCAGSKTHSVYEDGASAEDAQDKLYASEKAAGHTTCWPIWQGRVSS